jgi:transposase
MMPGVPRRQTADYVRHGTTTLFAALNVATGHVIGSLHRRHRAEEFRRFLIKLDKEVPSGLAIHLICDNYATHKTPAIKTWLLAHPRFTLHFTPTGSSWLNLVERWFAELTNKHAAGSTPLSRLWKTTFVSGSPPGTTTPSPTSGPKPLTTSSSGSPRI